jgi:hypothetical protein
MSRSRRPAWEASADYGQESDGERADSAEDAVPTWAGAAEHGSAAEPDWRSPAWDASADYGQESDGERADSAEDAVPAWAGAAEHDPAAALDWQSREAAGLAAAEPIVELFEELRGRRTGPRNACVIEALQMCLGEANLPVAPVATRDAGGDSSAPALALVCQWLRPDFERLSMAMTGIHRDVWQIAEEVQRFAEQEWHTGESLPSHHVIPRGMSYEQREKCYELVTRAWGAATVGKIFRDVARSLAAAGLTSRTAWHSAPSRQPPVVGLAWPAVPGRYPSPWTPWEAGAATARPGPPALVAHVLLSLALPAPVQRVLQRRLERWTPPKALLNMLTAWST